MALLGEKVTEMAREITGSGNPPDDLLNLVSQPYITGTVDTFKIHALNTHSQVMTKSYPRTWDKLVAEHNAFYHDLVQSGKYPPAKGGQKDADEHIQALVAQAVDKKFGKLVPNKQGQSGGNGKKKQQGGRTCYECGSPDHLVRDCPKRKPAASSSDGNKASTDKAKDWKTIPPNSGKGESKEKVVDGLTYKWCGKCRANKGYWNGGEKAHFTLEHRGRNSGEKSGEQPAATLGFVSEPLSFGFCSSTWSTTAYNKKGSKPSKG